MENTIEFDIALLLAILAMLDKNTAKGEEYGNESERSKDTVILNEED